MHRIPAELLVLSPREVWIPVRFLALSRWAEFTIFLLNLLLADNRGAVSSSWPVACVPSSGKSSFSEGSSLAGMQEAGVQLCSPTETEVCLLLLAHILWGIFSGTNFLNHPNWVSNSTQLDTNYPEFLQSPQVKGSIPQEAPRFRQQPQVSDCRLHFQLNSGAPMTPSSGPLICWNGSQNSGNC